MDKAFLDVNVPMYAAGREHPYREPCRFVMAEVASGKLSVVVDAEIFQEIMYRFGAIERWEVGAEMASALLELVPEIIPVEVKDVRKALDLFRKYGPKGVSARDTLHAAVMLNRDLQRIISVDRHFDLIEGIERVDPRDLWDNSRSKLT